MCLIPGTWYLVLVFGNLFSERLFEFDPVFDLNICSCSVNGVQAQPWKQKAEAETATEGNGCIRPKKV